MSSLTSELYATTVPFTYQNIGDKREEISLNLKRCPSHYSLSRKMKRFPFVMVSVTSR